MNAAAARKDFMPDASRPARRRPGQDAV